MAREVTPLERYQNTRVAIGEMLAGLFSGDAAEDALLLERLAGYRKPAHIPLEKLGHVYAVLKAEKAACESLGKDTYEDTLSVEQKAALYMAAARKVIEGAKAGGMQEKTCSWHTFRALLNEAIKGVPRQEREAAIKGMAGPPQKAPPKKKKAAKAATKKKTFVPPTLAEVAEYCRGRNNGINPQHFIDYYEAAEWTDSKGEPVLNWKQRVISWERFGAPAKAGTVGRGQNIQPAGKAVPPEEDQLAAMEQAYRPMKKQTSIV